ncbi:MAG: hypothetical protein C0523_06240 [Cytophaga sp.]|nr:hypothetical protein [Cytophaga sp.]
MKTKNVVTNAMPLSIITRLFSKPDWEGSYPIFKPLLHSLFNESKESEKRAVTNLGKGDFILLLNPF